MLNLKHLKIFFKIISISILLFCSNSLMSQIISQNVRLSYVNTIPVAGSRVILSPNQNKYESSAQMKPGFSIGYLLDFNKSNVNIVTGLETSLFRYDIINKKNERSVDFSTGGLSIFPTLKTSLVYLSVPIEAHFKFKAESKISFCLGSSIDFLIYKREKSKKSRVSQSTISQGGYSLVIESRDVVNTDKSKYNLFNFNARVGVDYEINRDFKINMNFNRKLLNIHSDYTLTNTSPDEVELDLDLYSISIGLTKKIR